MPAAVNKKVKAANERSLERALKEERLALAAITKVFLIEVPDPARVLARLEAMTRAASANPATPAATRKMLLDAVRFVRTAIERETGRPQSLFDPHVGHIEPKKVDEIVDAADGPVQLGLINNESVLGDVEAAHQDRVDTISRVHTVLVAAIQVEGACNDQDLHHRYLRRSIRSDLPPQSKRAITERRKELVAAGRLVSAGNSLWDVVERNERTA